MSDVTAGAYRLITASVRGPSHSRSGEPNQDAVAAGDPASLPLVVAVADGHGSERSFRSERGSQAAVSLAIEELTRLAEHSLDDVVDAGPTVLVDRWRAAVLADAAADPIEDSLSGDDRLRVYGSTLVAAVVSDEGTVYLQLGDGDVLEVDDGGTVRRGVTAEAGVDSSETTSLCLDGAAGMFRVRRLPADHAPAMVLLASDGYSNSFVDEPSFLQVGSDLLARARDAGIDEVAASLPDWLEETTAEGSGDDVTVALLIRDARTVTRTGGAEHGRPWTRVAAVVGTLALLAGLFLFWMLVVRGDGVDPQPDVSPTPNPSATMPTDQPTDVPNDEPAAPPSPTTPLLEPTAGATAARILRSESSQRP